MTRPILIALLFALLSGCADYGLGNYGNSTRYPDTRYPDNGRYDDRTNDYSRTPEYRRISSDAADYARRVDNQLRIGDGQERRIRDLLVDRTARLLQQTRPRDHSSVYPFPRRFSNSRAERRFWDQADRDIERVLGRNDADAYRYYVRDGGRYDRRSDTRYDNGNGRQNNNGRGNGRSDRDDRGRDDGERGQVGRNDRQNQGRGTSASDARRPNETLEEWYRRQQRRTGND